MSPAHSTKTGQILWPVFLFYEDSRTQLVVPCHAQRFASPLSFAIIIKAKACGSDNLEP